MKSQLTIDIAVLIACFALTTSVQAGAVLVVHTDSSASGTPGSMELHVGNTGASFPGAGSILAQKECDNSGCSDVAKGAASDNGGSISISNFSIESASGAISVNSGQNLPIVLGLGGTALFQNTANLYAEIVNPGNANKSFADGSVVAIDVDLTGAAGPTWSTGGAMDLKVPFPAQGFFGQVAYIGVVPEPTSIVMLICGLGMLLIARRSR